MKRTNDAPDTLGYRRVSKGEQAAEWKTSLADQTRAIIARARALGRTLLPEHVWEDRFSGEDAESRTGFMGLVRFCREHPRPRRSPGFAIFLNDSRFGRFTDPDEAAHWRFEFARTGWMVRFAENDDTDNLTTRHVMRSIGGAQASEYLANLKRNARAGARGAAAQGLWQNEAPFGYRRLATAPGRSTVVLEIGQRKSNDQQVRLTPGPAEEVEMVVWMYERYAAGLISLGGLVQALRNSMPSRLKWSKSNVGKMLCNRTYLGEVIWCRRPHDKRERQDTPVRPESEWVVTRGAHPALISEELFDSVQVRLAKNKRQTRATAGGYPLSGLVRCAVCGGRYVGGGGRLNHADPDDLYRWRYYKCAAKDYDPTVCPGKIGTVAKRFLEGIVIEEVSKVVSDPLIQTLIDEEIGRQIAHAQGDEVDHEAVLERQRTALIGQRDNVVNAVARGVATEEEVARQLAEIRTGLAQIDRKLRLVHARSAAKPDLEVERRRLTALAADFASQAKLLKGAELRELVVPWIQEASYDKRSRELRLVIRRIPAPDRPGSPAGLSSGARGTVTRVARLAPGARDGTGQWVRMDHAMSAADERSSG